MNLDFKFNKYLNSYYNAIKKIKIRPQYNKKHHSRPYQISPSCMVVISGNIA